MPANRIKFSQRFVAFSILALFAALARFESKATTPLYCNAPRSDYATELSLHSAPDYASFFIFTYATVFSAGFALVPSIFQKPSQFASYSTIYNCIAHNASSQVIVSFLHTAHVYHQFPADDHRIIC